MAANGIPPQLEKKKALNCSLLIVMQQPVDGSTYYSGVFQEDSDVDARYSSFLQGGAFHKVDSINGHAEASGLNTISREVNASCCN